VQIIHTAVTAAWRWATARAEAISCCTAFAPDADMTPDQMVTLVGWTPPLTEGEASRLTEAAAGGASREQFVAALHDEIELGKTWVDGFLARPAPNNAPPNTSVEQENGTSS
jgi:hypothetical protein